MDLLKKCLDEQNIDISGSQIDQFREYYELLISWNRKINLTSIVEKEDVIIKHFTDSLSMLCFIDISDKRLLDIGTGAGFPGIPLKILRPDCSVVLLDSLKKRIGFLDTVINELGLEDIETVHGRAEDIAYDPGFRESFDFVVSRAVAGLNTLSEYSIPFVKNKGYFISYKSGNVDKEIVEADNALKILGGNIDRVERFTLPDSDYERSLVFIHKTGSVSDKYPRKAGVPLKKPL